jgi:hypothetical protein
MSLANYKLLKIYMVVNIYKKIRTFIANLLNIYINK